jgi:hypothetical protein
MKAYLKIIHPSKYLSLTTDVDNVSFIRRKLN